MIAYSTVLNPYLNIFHLADLIFNLRFYRTLNFILSKCKNPKKNKRPIGHIIHLKNTSNFDLIFVLTQEIDSYFLQKVQSLVKMVL